MSNSQLSILNVRADEGGLGWLAARCSLVASLQWWVASCTWDPDANPCKTPNLIKKANPCQLFARWLETFNFQLSIFSGVEPRTSYRPFVNLAPSLPPFAPTFASLIQIRPLLSLPIDQTKAKTDPEAISISISTRFVANLSQQWAFGNTYIVGVVVNTELGLPIIPSRWHRLSVCGQ